MPAAQKHRSILHRATIRCAAALAIGAIAVPAVAGSRDASSLTPAEIQARQSMSPKTSGVFITEGIRLPYVRCGQGDVVLILPDSTEGLESWQPQITALGERFETVAYLRRSDVAPGAPTATTAPPSPDVRAASTVSARGAELPGTASRDEGALRDLLVFAASLTSSPMNVIGEGEGARLALRLALEYPERVRSLVLSAPDPHWFARDAAVEAARTGAALPAAVDTMLVCRRLWRLSVPVLVLTGERDPRTFGEASPLRCIRNARQQVFGGAGTRPHSHATDEFDRAVTRFLERQRMTAGEP